MDATDRGTVHLGRDFARAHSPQQISSVWLYRMWLYTKAFFFTADLPMCCFRNAYGQLRNPGALLNGKPSWHLVEFATARGADDHTQHRSQCDSCTKNHNHQKNRHKKLEQFRQDAPLRLVRNKAGYHLGGDNLR